MADSSSPTSQARYTWGTCSPPQVFKPGNHLLVFVCCATLSIKALYLKTPITMAALQSKRESAVEGTSETYHVENTVLVDLDDTHRAALEDNPEKPEKLSWSTILSVFVSLFCAELEGRLNRIAILMMVFTVPRSVICSSTRLRFRPRGGYPRAYRHRFGRHHAYRLDSGWLVCRLVGFILHRWKSERYLWPSECHSRWSGFHHCRRREYHQISNPPFSGRKMK